MRKIKIIGIVLIVLGAFFVLSNGLPYLILKLVDYQYEIVPYGKFYLSPVYLILTGFLLIISGLLIKSYKKIGVYITILSIIVLLTLITLHTISNIQGFEGDLKLVGTIGSIIFILIFLIPSVITIRFLLKKDNKKILHNNGS